LGGGIGILTGIATSSAIGTLFTLILPGKEVWNAVITPGSIGGIIVCVILIGIFAGVVPAYRASKLDPSEALRYE
jgi:putative ABC transport system permease protein